MLAAIFPQSNCHHGASVEYGANRGGSSDAVLMTMLESPLKRGEAQPRFIPLPPKITNGPNAPGDSGN